MSERSSSLDAGRLYLVPLLAALAVLGALGLPLLNGQPCILAPCRIQHVIRPVDAVAFHAYRSTTA